MGCHLSVVRPHPRVRLCWRARSGCQRVVIAPKSGRLCWRDTHAEGVLRDPWSCPGSAASTLGIDAPADTRCVPIPISACTNDGVRWLPIFQKGPDQLPESSDACLHGGLPQPDLVHVFMPGMPPWWLAPAMFSPPGAVKWLDCGPGPTLSSTSIQTLSGIVSHMCSTIQMRTPQRIAVGRCSINTDAGQAWQHVCY